MRRVSSGIGGVGLALLLFVLEKAEVKLPLLLLVSLGVIAAGMVLFGIFPWLVTAWNITRRIRIRVSLVPAKGTETESAAPSSSRAVVFKDPISDKMPSPTPQSFLAEGQELLTTAQTIQGDEAARLVLNEIMKWEQKVSNWLAARPSARDAFMAEFSHPAGTNLRDTLVARINVRMERLRNIIVSLEK